MKKLAFRAKVLLMGLGLALGLGVTVVSFVRQEVSHYMTVQELVETLGGDEELLIIEEDSGDIVQTCDKYSLDRDILGARVVSYGVCPDSYEEVGGELTYIPTLTVIIA